MLEDCVLVAVCDRPAEQQDVGHLTIHRDDRRIGGRHHHQFGVHLVADDLAQAVCLPGIWFDREVRGSFGGSRPRTPVWITHDDYHDPLNSLHRGS